MKNDKTSENGGNRWTLCGSLNCSLYAAHYNDDIPRTCYVQCIMAVHMEGLPLLWPAGIYFVFFFFILWTTQLEPTFNSPASLSRSFNFDIPIHWPYVMQNAMYLSAGCICRCSARQSSFGTAVKWDPKTKKKSDSRLVGFFFVHLYIAIKTQQYQFSYSRQNDTGGNTCRNRPEPIKKYEEREKEKDVEGKK